jgi:hypothetical protein
MSDVIKYVCETEADANSLIAWVDGQLGLPSGNTTTYAVAQERIIDNKWYMNRPRPLIDMTGCPITPLEESFLKAWIPIPSEEDADSYDLRIYKYMDENSHETHDRQRPPKDVNYNLLPLKKLVTKTKGEETLIEYFDWTTDELVVKEDRVYTIANNVMSHKDTTTTWYREDGTAHPDTKLKPSYYGTQEGMKAIFAKYENIYLSVAEKTVGYIMMSRGVSQVVAQDEAKVFASLLTAERSEYVQGDRQNLIDFITNYTDTAPDVYEEWLDATPAALGGVTTPRSLMISELSNI